jgi:Zn-finger nucleic acid-binding protein
MQMKTCANCSRPLGVVTISSVSFERCPQCGGAWLNENAFEELLQSGARSAGQPGGYRSAPWTQGEGVGIPRRVKSLLMLAAAGAVALVTVVGVAGYFLVWPLVSQGLKSGTFAKVGSEVVGKEMKALGVPADIGAWAQATAKKKVDDTVRNAVGLPPKQAQGEAKQAPAEATEAE